MFIPTPDFVRPSVVRLRHKIAIQSRTEAKNAQHELIQTWTTLCEVYSAIKDTTSKETVLANQLQSETAVRFVIRYRSDIDSTMRIVYGSKTYQIDSVVDPNETRNELIIYARCVQ